MIEVRMEPGDSGLAIGHLGSHLQVRAIKLRPFLQTDLAGGQGGRGQAVAGAGLQHTEPQGDLGD